MLHVQRGIDVDARRQQFTGILPAARVTRFRRIGVRQFIKQQEARLAAERAVDVEFAQLHAPVVILAARKNFVPIEQSLGFRATMGLDDSDNDPQSFTCPVAGVLQHRIGLADAGPGAEEYLEPATFPPALPVVDLLQKFFGVWPPVIHGAFYCPAES